MRRPWPDLLVVGVALLLFLPGLGWGLPSRNVDARLFGDRTPWTGEEIIALAGGFEADADRGADVDANPLDRADGVVLNATDAQRAEIVRRYRLMSRQPDEFINFSAIAGMAERRDGDPRLYQYGGVWLYGVAALLAIAKVLGLATVSGDLTHYLDKPADFGVFYVIARGYSVLFGVLAVLAVRRLVTRLTASTAAGIVVGVVVAMLPVVIVGAHEAKPHLGGLALTLWAVLWADTYSRERALGALLMTGVLIGLAAGTVISAVLVAALAVSVAFVPQVAAALRAARPTDEDAPHDASRHVVPGLWGAGVVLLIAGVTYLVTNPWVAINAVRAPHLLSSNVGNSTAMYTPTLPLLDATRILLLGGGRLMLVGLAGLLALAALAYLRRRRVQPIAWHLLAVTLPASVVFVLLARDKPSEYARFGLLPITVLAVVAVMLMQEVRETFRRRHWRGGAAWLALPVLLALLPALLTWTSYVGKTNPPTASPADLPVLYVANEPAPWSMPSGVNLWQTRLILGDGEPRVVLEDDPSAPLSWASKHYYIEPTDHDPATTQ